MDKEIILNKMLKIFKENGIIILEEDIEQPLEIDSLRFISIIVQIEEAFDVMVPDEALLQQDYPNIESFVHMVSLIIN